MAHIDIYPPTFCWPPTERRDKAIELERQYNQLAYEAQEIWDEFKAAFMNGDELFLNNLELEAIVTERKQVRIYHLLQELAREELERQAEVERRRNEKR